MDSRLKNVHDPIRRRILNKPWESIRQRQRRMVKDPQQHGKRAQGIQIMASFPILTLASIHRANIRIQIGWMHRGCRYHHELLDDGTRGHTIIGCIRFLLLGLCNEVYR